jgi:hypothetical protein
MLVRLMPIHGGDGTVHRITVIYDTGSNILTLFTTDLLQLGNTQGYNGWRRSTRTTDANGTVTVYRTILVQVQLLRDDSIPIKLSIPFSTTLLESILVSMLQVCLDSYESLQ